MIVTRQYRRWRHRLGWLGLLVRLLAGAHHPDTSENLSQVGRHCSEAKKQNPASSTDLETLAENRSTGLHPAELRNRS